MSQRVAKVESLVQQIVATAISELLEGDAVHVTVTRVDVSPDIRNATIWLGLLGNEKTTTRVWEQLEAAKPEMQAAVGRKITTKFVPKLHLKRDTGGEYAAEIDRLLRQI